MSSKRVAATAALVLGLVAAARAETYVVFDPPESSGQQVAPTSINASGDVAGFYYTSRDIAGFLRSAGGAVTVFHGPENLLAQDINSARTIVGYTSFSHGFVRAANGAVTPYNVPGSDSTYVYAVNAVGDVAGTYWSASRGGGSFIQPASGPLVTVPGYVSLSVLNDGGDAAGYVAVQNGASGVHGWFRARDGSQTVFTAPHVGRRPAAGDGARNDYTVATGINAGGSVTGYAYDTCLPIRGGCNGYREVRSFVRAADGTITSFRMPDAPNGDTGRTGPFAAAINAAGTVTGYYNRSEDANFVYHGFLRDASGRITTFDVPGMATTSPAAINDSGVVTGYCADANGVQHGFVRLP